MIEQDEASKLTNSVQTFLQQLPSNCDVFQLLFREHNYRRLYRMISDYVGSCRDGAYLKYSKDPRAKNAQKVKDDALVSCAIIDQFLIMKLAPLLAYHEQSIVSISTVPQAH